MSDLISHRVDLERALLDPPSCFDTPHDVLCSPELSRTQKIEILCRWAYDARELAVAEEEGMGGGDNTNNLDAVVAALNSLVGSVDVEHSAPTKHAASCVRAHSPTVLSSKGTTLKALGLLSVAAGTMWLAQSARASAFAIQEQSASALSRALAVTVSTPDDPRFPRPRFPRSLRPTPTDSAVQAKMREAMDFDVVIVGAGPAGFPTAIRLKQLGIERGETCFCEDRSYGAAQWQKSLLAWGSLTAPLT